eukprot:scaffold98814_cov73-Phaeocystis_antarctica.AAC.13
MVLVVQTPSAAGSTSNTGDALRGSKKGSSVRILWSPAAWAISGRLHSWRIFRCGSEAAGGTSPGLNHSAERLPCRSYLAWSNGLCSRW